MLVLVEVGGAPEVGGAQGLGSGLVFSVPAGTVGTRGACCDCDVGGKSPAKGLAS